jgi:phosphoadenosine phosphosulfate reductase
MPPAELNSQEIAAFSAQLEALPPQEILAWAVVHFQTGLVLSSSFQTESLPLLHLIHQLAPNLPILFIDTGFHFWETLLFREQIQRTWGLNVIDLHADESWNLFLRRFGRDLPYQDPDLCCYIRKVLPLQRALLGQRAWISGIRRDQTAARAQASILEPQPGQLLKINPLLNWSEREVWEYIRRHDLPLHPLYERGYTSIGCALCTVPVRPGEAARAGRWAGRDKNECGLHTELFRRPPAEITQHLSLNFPRTSE